MDNEVELLWFTARWCGPCRTMQPIFDQLIAEGHKVTKVDVDIETGLARQHGIYAVPTFIATKNGQAVARASGARPKGDLLNLLAQANA